MKTAEYSATTISATKAVLHGLSRVAIAKAQGNKTSSAFWSGFASSAISPFRESVAGKDYTANVVFNAYLDLMK